jgi:hypothetical protein
MIKHTEKKRKREKKSSRSFLQEGKKRKAGHACTTTKW